MQYTTTYRVQLNFNPAIAIAAFLSAFVILACCTCLRFGSPSVAVPNVHQWSLDSTWNESWRIPKSFVEYPAN